MEIKSNELDMTYILERNNKCLNKLVGDFTKGFFDI